MRSAGGTSKGMRRLYTLTGCAAVSHFMCASISVVLMCHKKAMLIHGITSCPNCDSNPHLPVYMKIINGNYENISMKLFS